MTGGARQRDSAYRAGQCLDDDAFFGWDLTEGFDVYGWRRQVSNFHPLLKTSNDWRLKQVVISLCYGLPHIHLSPASTL